MNDLEDFLSEGRRLVALKTPAKWGVERRHGGRPHVNWHPGKGLSPKFIASTQIQASQDLKRADRDAEFIAYAGNTYGLCLEIIERLVRALEEARKMVTDFDVDDLVTETESEIDRAIRALGETP